MDLLGKTEQIIELNSVVHGHKNFRRIMYHLCYFAVAIVSKSCSLEAPGTGSTAVRAEMKRTWLAAQ
jgi:hypothetical protein